MLTQMHSAEREAAYTGAYALYDSLRLRFSLLETHYQPRFSLFDLTLVDFGPQVLKT